MRQKGGTPAIGSVLSNNSALCRSHPPGAVKPQGTVAQLNGYHKRAKVAYDDGEEEWIKLPQQAFQWLGPRARSAGCTPALKRSLASLGAQGAFTVFALLLCPRRLIPRTVRLSICSLPVRRVLSTSNRSTESCPRSEAFPVCSCLRGATTPPAPTVAVVNLCRQLVGLTS